ncbi:hypothetical protein M0722_16200 [Microbacterium sp. KSW4-16]|uniref:hypothetical protein n=1 Tax=Microbacterium aurugineum TaxID=2851642 RepID=UPI0020C08AB1|nr:hypothetical protein [Microbacterium aurugineum]MCK8468738.1 hypothetical protein [Microbacterium aurugineum]
MNLYLQHGYGKGQKIQTLSAAGALRGVILSPGDEDAATLSRTAIEAKELGLRVCVDPQTYVYSTAPKGVGRKHESHGIQFDDLHWSQAVGAITDQVARVGRMHDLINPGGLKFAPTVLQASFDDVWTSTAFQLARTSASEWGKEQTIATLAIEDTALDTWRQVDEWLDVATTLEVRGFYILVGRKDTSYPPAAWSTERLANLLRMIYVLSELNEYEVCWGYADGEGIAGIAAGASAIASGWNYSLRQFKPSKWQPTDRKGGAAPNSRFYLSRLWSPVLATAEADNLYASDLRESVFSPADQAFLATRPLEDMGVLDSQLQYLQSLSRQGSKVAAIDGVAGRLDAVQGAIDAALNLFSQIGQEGIPLAPRYEGRVRSLSTAIELFREAESL